MKTVDYQISRQILWPTSSWLWSCWTWPCRCKADLESPKRICQIVRWNSAVDYCGAQTSRYVIFTLLKCWYLRCFSPCKRPWPLHQEPRNVTSKNWTKPLFAWTSFLTTKRAWLQAWNYQTFDSRYELTCILAETPNFTFSWTRTPWKETFTTARNSLLVCHPLPSPT